ncbi:uncharacterized protein LOC143293032 isoform X2 [Babylonia areolata]
MQYSSKLVQYKFDHFGGFKIDEVQEEIRRGRHLKCHWCKQKKEKRRTGATSGCELRECSRSFHFYCAKEDPRSITSRRKRHGKKCIDLYWVFCSKKHKEEYQKTDKGKREESCSESDDDDEPDDHEATAWNKTSEEEDESRSSESESSDSETSTSSTFSNGSKACGCRKRILGRKTPVISSNPTSDSEASVQVYSEASGVDADNDADSPADRTGPHQECSDGADTDYSSESFGSKLCSSVNPLPSEKMKGADSSSSSSSLSRVASGHSSERSQTFADIQKKLQEQTPATNGQASRHLTANNSNNAHHTNNKRKKTQRWKANSKKPRPMMISSDESEDDEQSSARTSHKYVSSSKLLGLALSPKRKSPKRKLFRDRQNAQGKAEKQLRPSTKPNGRKAADKVKHHVSPDPPFEDVFRDSSSSESEGLPEKACEQHEADCVSSEPASNSGSSAEACGLQAVPFDTDVRQAAREIHEAEAHSNRGLEQVETADDPLQDASECLLVIPEDAEAFEGVVAGVQGELAQENGMTGEHVHVWSALHPPHLLPSCCMLRYFHDLAKAAEKKKWDEFEELLLSGSRILERLKTSYIEKVIPRTTCKKSRTLVQCRRSISTCLHKASKNNEYLMGRLVCRGDIYYATLFINDISDPRRRVRRALHHSGLFPLDSAVGGGDARLPSLDILLSNHLHEDYVRLETRVFLNWFRSTFSKDPCRVRCVPEDRFLRQEDSSSCSGLELLRSELTAADSSVHMSSEAPLIVFVHRMKSGVVRFEKYLRLCLGQYVGDAATTTTTTTTSSSSSSRGLRLACVFPVDNLEERRCPSCLKLDCPDCVVRFFAAFDPSQKPVTMLVAVVTRQHEHN